MSDRIDQFANVFGQKLAAIEGMIDAAKIGIEETREAGSNEHLADSRPVRHKFEEAKHVARSAESSMTKWLKSKEESSTAVVEGSKDDCESRKLERQAASAEDNAEAGICLAGAAIVNAVIATYEAIDAHRAAEQFGSA